MGDFGTAVQYRQEKSPFCHQLEVLQSGRGNWIFIRKKNNISSIKRAGKQKQN